MARWTPGLRCPQRWVAGIACGTITAFGVGCRSSDPQAEPPPRLSPAVQAALRPTEGVLAGEQGRIAKTSPSTRSVLTARPSWTDGVASSTYPVVPAAGSVPGGRLQTVAAVDDPVKSGNQPKPQVGVAPPTVSDKPLPGGTTSTETIDLGIALRLAGVDNPTINLAREQIREALALFLGARSLLLPSVNIGGNYHLHDGALQASFGQIRRVESQSLYLGFGARTLAAESVAFPGVRLFAHLGDAVFEPLAARQQIVVQRSNAQAVQNDILMQVAVAYINLVGAEARLEVLRQGGVDIGELVRLTRIYAQKGQGREGDADRTEGRASLVEQQLHQAEEQVAVASAELCRLLNLDPSIHLRTPGGPVLPVPLISEESDLEALVSEGIQNRPELYARAAAIQQARFRVQQERVRPLLPQVSVGFSGGLFGGGGTAVSSFFGQMNGRTDFDVFAVWNIQNLGFGNRAHVRSAQAIVAESIAAYNRTVNEVRREISESLADAQAASRRVQYARMSVLTAEEGFKLEMERIRLGQGRPIEILDSFRQLVDSRQELVAAISEYNSAQFRLFVAVGSNPLAGPADAGLPPMVEQPGPPMKQPMVPPMLPPAKP